MKNIPTQLIVGLGILLIGGGIVGGEYLLVKWYPRHRDAVQRETLELIPYKDDSAGIDMKVAAGINKKVEPFSGGVRISSPRLIGTSPSLVVTSQPNPDKSVNYTPEVLAVWETDGALHRIPEYHFEHVRIEDRDAVMIWQYKNRGMQLTTRIISPDYLVEATCIPGNDDEKLYMEACEESVRSIKVAGPPSPAPLPLGGVEEIPSPAPSR